MSALLDPFWYAGIATDPFFANVVLLLHLDGANGSTTIIDNAVPSHTVTATTNTLTTANPKFGTASLLNTTSSYAVALDSPDWLFGAGQFTVEAWVYPTTAPTGVRPMVAQFGSAGNLGWLLCWNGNAVNFYYSITGSDLPFVTGAYTPALNSWVHIAADRDASNTLRVYAGGAVLASGSAAGTLFNSTRSLRIGNDEVATRGFVGQIDEVRITKGVARYAGAFTPPVAAFADA